MTLKAEIKQAEEKLASFGGFLKEDKNSLEEIKNINKQLKKIILGAEKEIKNTKAEVKKAHKELKKAKGTKKEENDIIAKIREQEKELLFNYNEQTSSTLLELTNKCQEAQSSIQKIKVKDAM